MWGSGGVVWGVRVWYTWDCRFLVRPLDAIVLSLHNGSSNGKKDT